MLGVGAVRWRHRWVDCARARARIPDRQAADSRGYGSERGLPAAGADGARRDDALGPRFGHPSGGRHQGAKRQPQRLPGWYVHPVSRRSLRDREGRLGRADPGPVDADGCERRATLRRQREAAGHRQVPPSNHRGPPGSHFGRHTDKETGVGPWFKPFTLEYLFAFTGLDKKGGY